MITILLSYVDICTHYRTEIGAIIRRRTIERLFFFCQYPIYTTFESFPRNLLLRSFNNNWHRTFFFREISGLYYYINTTSLPRKSARRALPSVKHISQDEYYYRSHAIPPRDKDLDGSHLQVSIIYADTVTIQFVSTAAPVEIILHLYAKIRF